MKFCVWVEKLGQKGRRGGYEWGGAGGVGRRGRVNEEGGMEGTQEEVWLCVSTVYI